LAHFYTKVFIEATLAVDVNPVDWDDDTELRGFVEFQIDDSTAFEALVIGHVLKTGTAVLVDRQFQYYLYTPENAQRKPWLGMRNHTVAKVRFDVLKTIKLAYFDTASATQVRAYMNSWQHETKGEQE
jgi:hypothetical protein